MLIFRTGLPNRMVTAMFAIHQRPMYNQDKALLLVHKPVRNRRVMRIITRLMRLHVVPHIHTQLPHVFRHSRVVSLRHQEHFRSACRLSNLANVQVIGHTQHGLTTATILVLRIHRVTHRRIFTRITAITVIINFTRSRHVTVVSNLTKVIISNGFFRHFHDYTNYHMLTNSFTCNQVSFQRRRTSDSTSCHGSCRRGGGAFRQAINISPAFFRPFTNPLSVARITFGVPVVVEVAVVLSERGCWGWCRVARLQDVEHA